ncbi:MAG: prephenate dehydratase [Candidatus Accumulibacter sp.]|jgi:chorismate mutase/prephenate dehydratase|nr:prephenate dehydratase [Accumulibacter sp.]
MSKECGEDRDFQEKLADARTEIDEIDRRILDLLSRRARCAQEIGRMKTAFGEGGVVYRPEREAQVLRRIREDNPGPLSNEHVVGFFREIMSACRSLESVPNIAFLGPLGTFSERAATQHFGRAARLLPQLSTDAIFQEVEAEHADYGVVPIENSTEGAIGRTMDLLMSTTLKICGEVVLRIHQHLLSNEASLSGIKKVYSHAQSLAQCHAWLSRTLPDAQKIPMGSNAQAAQAAAAEAGSAAIAGDAAAERYNLSKLADCIEDEPNNTTRFVVVGREQNVGPSGRDKTSLIMSAPNRTGSLAYLLAPISESGASMTRLESRPARHTLWEYVFFVDVEGHRDDAHVRGALAELERRAAYLKILGSYPVAAL